MGELIEILMSGFAKSYVEGKVTLLESIFYATIMPVLVTGGADEDSIITIESFYTISHFQCEISITFLTQNRPLCGRFK